MENNNSPLSPADEQAAAANRLARQMAGASIEPAAGGTSGAPTVPSAPAGAADAPAAARALTYVRLPCEGYGLSRFAREIGAICKTNGVFRMQNRAVTINYEAGEIDVMDPDRFRSYVEKLCVPAKFRWDKDGVCHHVEMTMGREVAQGTLRSDTFIENQRSINRLNLERMPIVRPSDNKLVLLSPGYDEEAKIFTMPTALAIDETMTLAQAKAYMDDLVSEIPFGDYKPDTPENREAGVVGNSRSKAVWISNALSLFGSGLLSPLSNRLHYAYLANAQRSGKTLLAKMAIVPIFGPAKVKTLPKDDNELRKMLTAAALGNAPYFFLDDLEGMLRSTELNAFMTAPTWSDRQFNKQADISASKQTVVVITGNNLGLSTDLANRTLRCQLYTDEFDAQSRKINRVIDEEYLARPAVRQKFLSALWCMIREWDAAGRPRGKKVLKGFEGWCDIFGGIVAHAGFGDPIEQPPVDDYTGDTEGADMITLVDVLVAEMDKGSGNDPAPLKKMEFTFADLIEAAQENDCFTWMMKGHRKTDKDSGESWLELDPSSKSTLGKMFSAKYGGRKFALSDGRRVKFGERGRNRHRRYVMEVMA